MKSFSSLIKENCIHSSWKLKAVVDVGDEAGVRLKDSVKWLDKHSVDVFLMKLGQDISEGFVES